MMNLVECHRSAGNLAEFLPWAELVNEGIVLNKDGSFQRTARFRGPDLDSSTQRELVAIADRFHDALRCLGSGWAVFVEAQRSPSISYPPNSCPDVASALVDAERRAQFEEEGAHHESTYFLTFLWLTPSKDAARAEGSLNEGRRREEATGAYEVLRGFVDRTDCVLQLVEPFMPECRWLDDGETLTYLHACVSTTYRSVTFPGTPMHLDALLADQPLTGGLQPMLGDQHLRVLTIVRFPTVTTPGILDDLNRLSFPYRWSTRAIMLDKAGATKILTKSRRQWFSKQKAVPTILKGVMTSDSSSFSDTDTTNKAIYADAVLQELGADPIGEAFVTATITVWDENPRIADERLRLVEKIIQGRDFTCMIETVNAVDAWLGSLPGHVYANVRQTPVSTLNIAHAIPLSAVWTGPARNVHLDAPALFFAKTEDSTPFRFSLHVGDVGHALVVGPTGAGKSVLLALMALQFRRYARSQIFAFDFGGSIKAAALAMKGDWYDLGDALADGASESIALQPLATIDDEAERGWAAEWITTILAREKIDMTPEANAQIWSALSSLASAPECERTLTGLSVLLQSQDLKRALQPYCLGGPFGYLLDAELERLGTSAVQVFETEGLVDANAAPAILSCLLHRMNGQLDGRPTLLIIDEGWRALEEQGAAGQICEWLETLRKKNASVVFATQSLSDIDGSPIASAIIESCPTRLYLPNARAMEPQITAIYRRFGLTGRQIEILARATPKRDYYCQSKLGNRLFELGLEEFALAFSAASSKPDHVVIERVLAEHGRQGFLTGWLAARGLGWAADLVPGLIKQGLS